MRLFEVWAPLAHRVELAIGTDRLPMVESGDGHWSVADDTHLPPLVVDVDYGFVLDGTEPPLPDPRSRRQPHGVHELSRTVALDEQVWTDRQWRGRELADGIIYELHVGTFTDPGTFDSAIERLDHLVDLGVTFVELLPVNAFNGIHNWGYDGVLWFAVHEPYGGPEGYQRFVDACHARSLAVIQDVVYNHLGPSGNYLPTFGPYLGESETTWGAAVNLDGEGSRNVRDYILDNADMWLREYHVDALRLDAVHALRDDSHLHLLAELSARVERLSAEVGRPLSLIAESDLNDPRIIAPRDQGGYGLTAQWNDDYHHAAHVAVTGETDGYYSDFASLSALAKTLSSGFFHDGTYSSFRGAAHGHPLDRDAVEAWRLVTFTQDHDQIGNRATGDRISHTPANTDALQAALTMLTPFTPMLFMGEEWGATTPWQFFTSHPEPDLGAAVAEGRLAEFADLGWDPDSIPDPQDPATVRRSTLDWSELAAPTHAELLAFYRRLARLRAELPGLRDPRMTTIACEFDEDARWLRFDRPGVSVVLNFSEVPRSVPVAGTRVALATDAYTTLRNGTLEVSARSAAVITRD